MDVAGYALMKEGRLRLKRPKDLLDDWVKHYRTHKPQEYGFYMRAELEQVEQQVANWCSQSRSEYALSRLLPAQHQRPELRLLVGLLPTQASQV